MAHLIVRRNASELHSPSTDAERFALMHWDPFQQMAPLWPGERPERFSPDFDIKETPEGILFKADVPGIREKDLEITLAGNRLTVAGQRDEETGEKTDIYYACERSYGSFTRSFTLPEGTGGGNLIRADLDHGVLTLLLPKKPERKPRRIEVKIGDTPES